MMYKIAVLLTFFLVFILSFVVQIAECQKETIVFPETPKGQDYETEFKNEDSIIMKGWYNAVKIFVKTVQPNKPPVESVYEYITGKKEFKMPESLKKILELEKGFVACVIFGLLFIIIMPIVGMFFCMCRMCGNCGGKMVQAHKKNLSCRRRTYFILLVFTFALMVIAVINMYACNQNMSQAIPESHKTIITNLDDTQKFINNTYTEIKFLAENCFDFAASYIVYNLDNINSTLGIWIREDLNIKFEVDEAFDHSKRFAAEAQPVMEDILEMVNDSAIVQLDVADKLKPAISQLTDILKTWRTTYCGKGITLLDPLCAFPPVELSVVGSLNDFDINIKAHLKEIKTVLDGNLVSHVQRAEDEFQSIPYHVKENTVSIRAEITNTIDDIRAKIRNSKEFGQLDDVRDAVIDSTDDTKAKIDDIIGTVEKYNNYRWWAGLFVCLMVSVCIGLIFLGLCGGVLGHKSDALPTQRSTVSNGGGILLMASVGFMFLFASFLMIVTTSFFLVGAHGEAFLCDVMYNDIPLLDKMKELATEEITDEPFIKDIKISHVLKECKANHPAYVALGLDKHFNISEIKDLVNRTKIHEEIDSINIDLTSIDVFPKDLEKLINSYAEGVNIDFQEVINTLETSVLNKSASVYVSELSKLLEQIPDAAASVDPQFKDQIVKAKAEIEVYIGNVTEVLGNVLPHIDQARGQLLDFVRANKDRLEGFHVDLTNITKKLLGLKNDTIEHILDVVKPPIKSYSTLLLGFADQYIDHLDNQTRKQAAKCKPLWNVYNSARFVICKLILDPFNGFWFALGWCCAFFIPAIIFSIKLSRHYRKMKYTEFEGVQKDKKKRWKTEDEAVEEYDQRGSERDNNWKYDNRDEMDHPHQQWVQELHPIYAYNNQNFRPDTPQQQYQHQQQQQYPLSPSRNNERSYR